MIADDPVGVTMSSGAGILARQRVAEAIANQSFDARQFMTFLAGEPENGVLEVALVSSGRTAGSWPSCLSLLKRSALEDKTANLGQRLAIADGSMQDYLDEDERRRQADRAEGRVVQLAGATEELLHYLASLNMEYRRDRVHEQMTGQLYGCLLYTSPSPRDS